MLKMPRLIKKNCMVPIKKITVPEFVRVKLRDSNLRQMAVAYKDPHTSLPPVWLAREHQLAAGRHRLQVVKVAGDDMIRSNIYDVDGGNRILMLQLGCIENGNGSLPLDDDDKLHVAVMLREAGGKIEAIGDAFQCPFSVARHYYRRAGIAIKAKLIQAAVLLVTNGGKSVPAAAKEKGVKLQDLRVAIQGRTRRSVADIRNETKQRLSKPFTSLNKKLSNGFKRILDEFHDGELPKKDVDALIKHIRGFMTRQQAMMDDVEGRFKAMVRSSKK